MHNHAGFGAALEPCRAERILDQLGLHMRLHRPAHHLPAAQVDDDSQVQPAFGCHHVHDIARPGLIRRRRREVALQQVRRDGQAMIPARRRNVLAQTQNLAMQTPL